MRESGQTKLANLPGKARSLGCCEMSRNLHFLQVGKQGDGFSFSGKKPSWAVWGDSMFALLLVWNAVRTWVISCIVICSDEQKTPVCLSINFLRFPIVCHVPLALLC